MVTRLSTADGSFEEICNAMLPPLIYDLSLAAQVGEIIAEVIKQRDVALLGYTTQFDKFNATAQNIVVSEDEIEEAAKQVKPEVLEALKLAAKRIEAYHKKQMPQGADYTDDAGVRLGWRWGAVDSVGLYVPGGLASYPSSVLMNAIPAKVAGVERIAMVVPSPEGVLNPLVLAAAKVAGITEIYKVGGAQAVAALAFGTETIAKVDMIVGPGNKYVAEAKRQVFGTVGIDMIAGPSEILVIADSSANPKWVAADLMSQAEHDTDARSVLLTDSAELADAVEQEVENLLNTLPRADIAKQSWKNNGMAVVTKDLEEAVLLSNLAAPEHLELFVEDAESLLKDIRHAGAIFIGKYTPEAVGDYTAGPSHVLPTSGNARFSSGLSVFTFLKRSSLIGCSDKGFAALQEATATLAQEEGLTAHALSATIRKTDDT